MANGNIRGITIEIGGDTTGLDNALTDVNKQSKDLQSELKQVERALKFDPGNTELVRQQQQLLSESIEATSQKLYTLRTAQSQVEEQFRNGQIGADQYRAFQRELINTESHMTSLQARLNSIGTDQDRLAQNTRQLGTFFEATNTDVEQFAGTLGTRLTQAIRDGSATADQMERALRLIGRQALGTSVDIDRMREALRTADDGVNLDRVRQDLASITQEANQAGDAVNGFGQELSGVVAGLAAGGGIAGVVQQALDVSSLDTKIDITFDVPEESKASVRDAIKSIEAYGVDGEEALEGVRRQWALNKDASDEVNAAIVKGAGVVAKAYQGIDFIELIQEVNEIAAAIEITNEEALALTNSLLKAGFPPEQLDTIAEYTTQMKEAGFSVAEIQSIFEKGIDTKTWNIDNLNDGVKEARLQMAAFGTEIPKSLEPILKNAGLSEKQFLAWGKAVAKGGSEGSKAMAEVVSYLDKMEEGTAKNDLATAVFATKWEDQGQNMISVFQGLAEAQDKTTENQNELNSAVEKMNQDPTVVMKQAFVDLQTALEPLLTVIAELVAKIAQWVSDNTALTAAIVAIVATLGILTGAFAALMPAIGGLVTAWPALAAIIGAITAPIALVVAAIAGLGVALVAAYQHSETFRENVNTVFQAIKDVAVTVFETVASFIGEKIAQIKQFWDQNGQQILQAVENVFNGIKVVIEAVMPAVKFIIESVWKAIQNVIDGALNVIMGAVKVFSGLFTGDFSKMWEGIKEIFSGAIELVMGLMTLSFFGGIKTLLTNLAKSGVSLLKGMWDDIGKAFSSMSTSAVNFVKDMASKVISYFTNLLNSAKSNFGTLKTFGETTWNALKSVVINAAKSIWDNVVKSFTGMLNSVKTNMTTVKTTISDLWSKAIAVIKPDSLLQVGKDVVNGLIKGIGDMFGGVKKKIEGLAALIPEWAKDILGIHSPSRVMAEVGKWTGEGLAVGMDGTKSRVQKSIEDLGGTIIDVAQHHLDEEKKITTEAKEEIAKIEKRSAEDIDKIKRTAASKGRQLTADELIKIERLQEDSALKIAEIQKKSTQQSVELISKNQKAMLEEIKLFIQDKKTLEELNLIEEATIWEKSTALFTEGTKERVEAQKAYQAAVQAINKEITAINTDYSNQIQKINEDLIKQEETLTKAYADAVDKRVQSLTSFKGLFDEFKAEIDVTGEELLTNLGSQVDGFKQWQQEVELLSTKAIDEGLLAELREMGPNALPELKALNSLTAEQLTRYSELYKEKSSLARKQAETELIGMKNDTDKQIKKMRNLANAELDDLKYDWQDKIKAITKATSTEFSTLEQIGRDAGNGLLQGLSSTANSIQKKALEIANSVKNTIQSALDIHSPSRVTMGFGVNVNEGLIKGMEQSQGRLQKAMNNVYGSLASSAEKSAQISSSQFVSSTSTIDNSRYMRPSITIINQVPNASPSELARKAVQAQRQLAMEWGV